jgi:nucleoside-diphosphate-sugar epimerase
MVIGNGLLARRFISYDNDDRFLIFASGVSNSKTKNQEAYNREVELLRESILKYPDKTIVYFSTCSIYDPDEINSAYVQHKLNIENIIQTTAREYFVFRVSNVAGKSPNPNTLLNYFYYHIKNGINFDLWANACRNIIDIDDVFFIADQLLKNYQPSNLPINIASPVNYPVKEIVLAIEFFLNTKSNYTEVSKGGCFEVDLSVIQPVLRNFQTKFDDGYLATLLAKYF